MKDLTMTNLIAGLKMQDLVKTDQVARVETARPDNDGPIILSHFFSLFASLHVKCISVYI